MAGIDGVKPKKNRGIEQFNNFDPKDGRGDIHDEKIKLDKNDFFEGSEVFGKKIAKKIKHHRLNLDLNYSYKGLFVSVLICSLVIFSLARAMAAKNETEKLSKDAKNHLAQAFNNIENGDMKGAIAESDQAGGDIRKIKLIAQSWGQDIQYLRFAFASNSKFLANERLLNASFNILHTVSSISSDLGKAFDSGIISASSADTAGVPSIDLSQLGKTADDLFSKVVSDLEKSKKDLIEVKKSLPKDELNDQAILAIDNALDRTNLTRKLLKQGLPVISGNNGSEKNILILLQNNSELRGSGGFIGSYSVATFNQGKMTKLEFQTNIYKLDTAFSAKTRVDPPENLVYVAPKGWALRDSNYAVDFSESAAKVSEFYNLETGKNIDGIIALDTTLFTGLLKVVGPIEMPEYGKSIKAENFLNDIQYEVEKGYFEREEGKQENEPKTILAEMMPKFFSKLMEASKDQKKLFEILEVFQSSLKEKHLMFNFKDQNVQGMVEQMGYAGRVLPTVSDYLYVHNTNINGMKSSLNVAESLKHKVLINQNGDITESLEVERRHNGSGVWPDGPNNNLVRILIPDSSKFIEFKEKSGNFWPVSDIKNKQASDYSVGREAGKMEVGFWQNTKPGEVSGSVLEYQSNYHVNTNANFSYMLSLQKQPGTLADDYELELTYPEGFRPINVKNFDDKNRTIVLKYKLNQDKNFLIKFEKL